MCHCSGTVWRDIICVCELRINLTVSPLKPGPELLVYSENLFVNLDITSNVSCGVTIASVAALGSTLTNL